MSGKTLRETLAALGVIASLVFVGIEIRTNTAVARTQARNDLATMDQTWFLTLVQDSSLTALLYDYWTPTDDLDARVRQFRAEGLVIAQLRTLENAYLFWDAGLLPESGLDAYGATDAFPTFPRFIDDLWPRIRPQFDPAFVQYLETRWGV